MPGSTDITLNWVQSLDEALAFKRWLGERRPILAVDTETGGFSWWRDPLRTVQFGDRRTGWCIEHVRWAGLIDEALREYERPIAMHNMKFDLHFLENNGYRLKRWLVRDTRAQAHLLAPHMLSGLKSRSVRVLGPWAKHGEEELKQAMMAGGWTWGTIPIDLLWRYAAFDTCLTAQLDEEQYPQIQAGWSGIYALELASTQVLLDMETRGMLTDRRYLSWAHEEWGLELEGIKHELKERWLVRNPNSREQIARRLSEDGVQFIVFTETGKPQLTEDVLDGIDHPVAKLALRYYELSSLRNTFVKNLLELADERGFLHPDINPLGARTGRMSVSRPSMQNMPAKDARIRDGFVAAPGETLISADYDQVEMRIFAHYSQDSAMLEAIRYGDAMAAAGHEGYDLHSMNARMVYSIGMEDQVPKHLRKRVKGVGFAKVYGTGLATFAATAGLSLDEAQSVLDAYDTAFPGVRAFQHTVTGALWQRQRENNDPFVVTAYGRKEPCDPHVAYKAVNYLIQGSAADVLKDRLVALGRTWLAQHMLMPIHDEILFQVPDDALADALAVIREVMPVRDRFQVPLTVDAVAVKRWGDKYRAEGESYKAPAA